jgi:two-component system, sensor histidine kinase and response regulator
VRLSKLRLLILCFFSVLAILSHYELSSIEHHTKEGFNDILCSSLKSSQSAVDYWIKDQTSNIVSITKNIDVRQNISLLLDAHLGHVDLNGHLALNQLRQYLSPWIDVHHWKDFIVFAPDGTSIASMSDSNVGISLPVVRMPDLLNTLFMGGTELVLPYRSPMNSSGSIDERGVEETTMLITAPVYDRQNSVMAVLAIRFDPSEDMSFITQIAQPGETGDNYLFNKQGFLLTTVRFDETLRKHGVIKPTEPTTLSVRVADPGVDMSNGQIPVQARQEMPLTLMAKEATEGNDGVNLTGYRDYRGVKVIGAWLWDERYNFGIASEMGISEVLEEHSLVEFTNLTTLLIIALIFASSVLSIEKKSKIIEKNEAKLDLITNSMRDAIILVDPHEKIQFWNFRAEEMFGITREKALGQKLYQLILPISDQKKESAAYNKFSTTGSGSFVGALQEMDAKHANGTKFPVELAVEALKMNSRWGALGSIRDISARKQDEKHFRELTHRFELATKAARVGIWDWYVPEDTLVWDDSMYFLYGLSKKDFKGEFEAWEKCLHPDDVADANQQLASALRGEKKFDTVFRIVMSDNTIRYIRAKADVHKDRFGNAVRMIGTNYEITPQMEAENALRELMFDLERQIKARTSGLEQAQKKLLISEERFRGLVETINDIIWEQDAQGVITYISPMVTDILGYEQEEMMGTSFFKHTLASDPAELWKKSKDNHNSLKNIQHQLGHKLTKSVIYLESNITPVFNSGGILNSFRGVSRDVTQRKFQSENLRKLSRAVEASPISVIITDAEGTIEYMNPYVLKTTGYSQEELLGENPRILKGTSQSQSFVQSLWETISKGQQWEGEFCNIRKDKTTYWEHALISPLFDEENQISHYVGVQENITERKKADQEHARALIQAQAAVQAKNYFLANMSHEIRTPMNAIIGMTYLALETDLNQRQRDYLNKINISAKTLLDIINGILDFSKIDAGKLHLEKTSFRLSDVIEDSTNLISNKIARKGLELLILIDKNVPELLVGDPIRIGQVFNNLLSNAEKFTSKGEIEVSVQVKSQEDQYIVLECMVADTGIGVSGSQQKQLFKTFSQADSSTTRRYGGTGLGLSIVKQLLKMMDGDVQLQSEQGKGSQFTFYFKVQMHSDSMRGSAQVMQIPSLTDKSVLLLNDNKSAALNCKKQLQCLSFTVIEPADNDHVLEAMKDGLTKEDEVALILVDFTLFKNVDFQQICCNYYTDTTAAIPLLIAVPIHQLNDAEEMVKTWTATNIVAKPLIGSSLFNAIADACGFPELMSLNRKNPTYKIAGHLKTIAGSTVLLVEDNPINQKVAIELIERLEVNVVVANDGYEALKKVQNQDFDLILMDIQMPRMDGLTACRNIRELKGKYEKLPIVAMTAHAMSGDREKSLEIGMNDHITKPIDPNVLYRCLYRWLKVQGQLKTAGVETSEVDIIGQDSEKKGLPLRLATLETEIGLGHVAGNKALYQQLLQNFILENQLFSEQMRQALTEKDQGTAILLSHTLKSVSGTIGAMCLNSLATALEDAIKENSHRLFDTLAGVENELGLVIEKIQREYLEKTVKEDQSPILAIDLDVDLDVYKDMLETLLKLENLAKIHDTRARNEFLEISDIFSTILPQEALEIQSGLEKFDFQTVLRNIQHGIVTIKRELRELEI